MSCWAAPAAYATPQMSTIADLSTQILSTNDMSPPSAFNIAAPHHLPLHARLPHQLRRVSIVTPPLDRESAAKRLAALFSRCPPELLPRGSSSLLALVEPTFPRFQTISPLCHFLNTLGIILARSTISGVGLARLLEACRSATRLTSCDISEEGYKEGLQSVLRKHVDWIAS